MKLPAKEAKEKASEVYHLWQDNIMKPEWNPFKTVTVEGTSKVVVTPCCLNIQVLSRIITCGLSVDANDRF